MKGPPRYSYKLEVAGGMGEHLKTNWGSEADPLKQTSTVTVEDSRGVGADSSGAHVYGVLPCT